MNRRSRPFAFSPRHSPAVNALYPKQLAEGLYKGPFPSQADRLALAVHLALREWGLYR